MEEFFATEMPSLASRGICSKKHNEAIRLLIDGIARWLIRLKDKFGSDFLEVVKAVQFQLGREVAEQMKEEYGLGNDIAAALDLMLLLITPFGVKMKAEKIGGTYSGREVCLPDFRCSQRTWRYYCDQICIFLGNG